MALDGGKKNIFNFSDKKYMNIFLSYRIVRHYLLCFNHY